MKLQKLLISFMAFIVVLVQTPTAYAATFTGETCNATVRWGRSECVGFFTGTANLQAGNTTMYSASLSTIADSTTFINTYRNWLNGTDERNRTSAAATIAIMLGANGTTWANNKAAGVQYARDNFTKWQTLITDYNTGGLIDWSYNYAAVTPFAQSGYNMTAQDVYFSTASTVDTIMAIRFRNPNGNPNDAFLIDKFGGNIKGSGFMVLSPNSVPAPPATWTYACTSGIEVQTVEDSSYPLSAAITTPSSVTRLDVQVGRRNDVSELTFSTSLPQTITKSIPDVTNSLYRYYTVGLTPTAQVNTTITGTEAVGDSLTAYIHRQTGVAKYTTGKRVERDVWWSSTATHTETFSVPATSASRNIDVTFVIGAKESGKYVVLTATAGSITRSVTVTTPSSTASLVRMVSLANVPATVTTVTATVRSPNQNEMGAGTEGDAAMVKGMNVTQLCDRVIVPPTPTSPPAAGGNIQNLNFGITNFKPWIQGTCGNIRMDGGIDNPVPTTALGGPYMIGTNASCTTPSVLHPGNSSPSLNRGQVSSRNWVAGGAVYPETFPAGNVITVSYNNMVRKTQASGTTITNLASVCNVTNCTLPNNLVSGTYSTPGDLYLNAHDVGPNRNYIFLVGGNLFLRGPYTVRQDRLSTTLFSVAGNIQVMPNVGVAANSTQTSLEGFFSTDRSFIIPSAGTCIDLRLNVGGALIYNAGRTGGRLQNDRDLCANDGQYPTFSVIQRLDFVLNAPPIITQQTMVSQEVAP